jgi:hypothetical protein
VGFVNTNPTKTWDELRFSIRVSSFYFTSATVVFDQCKPH